MDLEWCLTCERQLDIPGSAYCSQACLNAAATGGQNPSTSRPSDSQAPSTPKKKSGKGKASSTWSSWFRGTSGHPPSGEGAGGDESEAQSSISGEATSDLESLSTQTTGTDESVLFPRSVLSGTLGPASLSRTACPASRLPPSAPIRTDSSSGDSSSNTSRGQHDPPSPPITISQASLASTDTYTSLSAYSLSFRSRNSLTRQAPTIASRTLPVPDSRALVPPLQSSTLERSYTVPRSLPHFDTSFSYPTSRHIGPAQRHIIPTRPGSEREEDDDLEEEDANAAGDEDENFPDEDLIVPGRPRTQTGPGFPSFFKRNRQRYRAPRRPLLPNSRALPIVDSAAYPSGSASGLASGCTDSDDDEPLHIEHASSPPPSQYLVGRKNSAGQRTPKALEVQTVWNLAELSLDDPDLDRDGSRRPGARERSARRQDSAGSGDEEPRRGRSKVGRRISVSRRPQPVSGGEYGDQ